ncbi:O-succinylhomoserine sulfhydrylase [Thalassobaculum fulvum]|uniref:O-succinylhomoserine sulfhydrylase n=1 Tax=Thalassobaculum fulvum TaxID=1633335 RepID=A0A918XRJ8_9PROT|nr:O-succinylhomoserine sulfhydrylase [Thalassobaculum fulvum]GHD47108.1 O-succinylhomoserine sulfhydrylase [Thalassobaculum fulvum]
MTDRSDWRPATRLVRGGLNRSQFRETSEALFLNSGFVYDDAAQAEAAFNGDVDVFIYSRYGNPTVATFEERLALLEGADACRATATGMAAVFAAMLCQVSAGDRVVAARELFGSCHYIVSKLLPRWGVEIEFVKGTDLAAWEKALSRPATVTFLESPSNPMLDLVDIAAVAELSHKAGARLMVDNVFATPMFQRPLALGADIVVYSATKHIDGQGRCLGGAVLGDRKFIDDVFQPFYRNTGPSMSPFNAWVMVKSLETLELRVERHTRNAARIAEWLEARPDVLMVRYPGLESHPQHALAKRQMSGFGSLVTLELPGGKAAAFRFLDALQLIDISNNLGDAKSLVCHPATTTHSRLTDAERADIGVTPGVVRLSIGLEDPEDLIEDIDRALLAAAG